MTLSNSVAQLRTTASTTRKLVRPDRQLVVSREHGFVYYQVPKVATQSLTKAISQLDPDCLVSPRGDVIPRSLKGLKSFAFVRDPWDRLYSCWCNRIRDGYRLARFYPELCDLEFEDFVEVISKWDLRVCDPHLRLQSRLVPKAVGFVGRLETLVNDYDRLGLHLGVDLPALPWRNASSPTSTEHDPFSPQLRRQVAQLYAADVERFGYTTNPP